MNVDVPSFSHVSVKLLCINVSHFLSFCVVICHLFLLYPQLSVLICTIKDGENCGTSEN